MRILFVAIACGLSVAGCAEAPELFRVDESPSTYEGYTCEQLALEASAVSSRLASAMGPDYTGDKIAMDVGRVVFFPILVFEKGNYANPFEVARLRRSMDAIEQASIEKNCGITFQHASPPPPQVSQWHWGPE